MKDFAELFKRLDETNKTNEKINALSEYFTHAADNDKLWAIALLSHRRPKRAVNTRLLREWSAEFSGISLWLFEETYHVVGDLAETIALLLPDGKASDKSLTWWVEGLIGITSKTEHEKKKFIIHAWTHLDRAERFIFNKILTGGFRIGVSQKIMVRGLAKATGVEENILSYQLTGNWSPQSITYEELIHPKGNKIDISKPYPFFLAYALEKELSELGPPDLWQAEYKWDGIRGQLIKRDGEIFLWSRGEELVLDKFPEFLTLLDKVPDGVVIDGEILPWKMREVMGFNDLQTRLGRKNVSSKLMEKVPVILMAYDLLEVENEDIRSLPLQKRRMLLEGLVKEVGSDLLLISDVIRANLWEEITSARENSRELGAEGLMLKRKDSIYDVGRKKGGWWKWKVDPFTVDAVLTYAMRGHGRRANLYTDFTFGLWHEGELITFAKAYSGLTDAEMREVDRFVRKNTLERFGPVRMVVPELVFELAFEGIAKSKRHKSGFAVRFPRIMRWRRDKHSSEANSLQDLEQLSHV